MLSPRLKDVLQVVRAEVGEETGELLVRAGREAAASSAMNAEALCALTEEEAASYGDLQMWQLMWHEVAAARPARFELIDESLSATELALSYAMRSDPDGLQPIELTAEEDRELTAVLDRVATWTGLEDLRQPCKTVVVSENCVALRNAAGSLHSDETAAMAFAAPLWVITIHERDVVYHRDISHPASSELVSLLLHERLHLALARRNQTPAGDGWQVVAPMAEEAAVSALQVLGYWWLRDGLEPAASTLRDGADYHHHGPLFLNLLDALDAPDTELVDRLCQVAFAAVDLGADEMVVPELNRLSRHPGSFEEWRRRLPSN